MKYIHIACGGTFDFFHLGHQAFLAKTFDASAYVTIGITSDLFAISLGKRPYYNFSTRKLRIEQYLKQKNLFHRAKIVKLNDIYGTTLVDKTVQAIAVTPGSISGALQINDMRQKLNLLPLSVVYCEMKVGDDGQIVSSTRIWAGEISPDGFNYFTYLKKYNFILPKKLRPILARPYGKLVKTTYREGGKDLFVTVGDQTTVDCIKSGNLPNISVVDFKIQRVLMFRSIQDLGIPSGIKVFKAKNPAGTISYDLSVSVKQCFLADKNSVVVVDGEEDLSVLPIVLIAPIDTRVLYGIRNKGLMMIRVNQKIKEDFLKLSFKFRKKIYKSAL